MKAYVNVQDEYILKDIVSVTFVNGKLILVMKDGKTNTYSEDSLSMYDEKNPSITITA